MGDGRARRRQQLRLGRRPTPRLHRTPRKIQKQYDARGTDGGIRKVMSDWASTDSTYGPWLGRAQGGPRTTGTTL